MSLFLEVDRWLSMKHIWSLYSSFWIFNILLSLLFRSSSDNLLVKDWGVLYLLRGYWMSSHNEGFEGFYFFKVLLISFVFYLFFKYKLTTEEKWASFYLYHWYCLSKGSMAEEKSFFLFGCMPNLSREPLCVRSRRCRFHSAEIVVDAVAVFVVIPLYIYCANKRKALPLRVV